MRRSIRLCSTLALLIGAAPHASASPEEQPAPAEKALPGTTEFFDTYDANYDGAVTQEEFGGSQEIFRYLDSNKDGRIAAEELGLPVAWKPTPASKAERVRGRQGSGLKRRAMERLAEYDLNNDGRVAKSEWLGDPEQFKRRDRNGDGFLDAKDFERQRGRNRLRDPAKAFAKMDANQDGIVSREEFKGPDRFFDRLDKNGDGQIDRDEVPKRGARDAAGSRRRRGRALTAGMLRRFDEDGDGKVTADEFAGNDAQFKRLDKNGDGVLDKQDFAKAPKRAKPQPKPAEDATPPSAS